MVPTGMGGSRDRVGIGVFRNHQGVQFSNYRHPGSGSTAPGIRPLSPGARQPALVYDAKLVKLLRDQGRGRDFPEPGFGVGQDLPGNPDNVLLPPVDRGAGPALQFFDCQSGRGGHVMRP